MTECQGPLVSQMGSSWQCSLAEGHPTHPALQDTIAGSPAVQLVTAFTSTAAWRHAPQLLESDSRLTSHPSSERPLQSANLQQEPAKAQCSDQVMYVHTGLCPEPATTIKQSIHGI
jgi:hypothetical protein